MKLLLRQLLQPASSKTSRGQANILTRRELSLGEALLSSYVCGRMIYTVLPDDVCETGSDKGLPYTDSVRALSPSECKVSKIFNKVYLPAGDLFYYPPRSFLPPFSLLFFRFQFVVFNL